MAVSFLWSPLEISSAHIPLIKNLLLVLCWDSMLVQIYLLKDEPRIEVLLENKVYLYLLSLWDFRQAKENKERFWKKLRCKIILDKNGWMSKEKKLSQSKEIRRQDVMETND